VDSKSFIRNKSRMQISEAQGGIKEFVAHPFQTPPADNRTQAKIIAMKKGPRPIINPTRSSSHPSSIFNMPPKKVVKASCDYTARAAGELSFKMGDFFCISG
jgi:hypothetical protein